MTESELTNASHEILVALIAELRAVLAVLQTVIAQHEATIAELLRRISDLEQRLSTRGSPGMPGNKPTKSKPHPVPRPRKKRAQGFGRPRMTPTQTVVHAVAQCPTCQRPLVGGWVQRTRQVIELPLLPVEVSEHQYLARECPFCGTRHVPPVELDGVVVGKRHRLGVGLVSVIAILREEGRLPFGMIQWYLQTVHHLHLSQGALVAVVNQVAKRGQPAVEAIQGAIQASPVVNADETGWRETGKNGYVWTVSTPTARFFRRGARTKEMIDEILGPSFGGKLVSDFYAAYHHFTGIHQRCWAHLLRDIHDLTELYPTDPSLTTWATAVRALYDEALAFHASAEPPRLIAQHAWEERLLAVCRPFVADPLAVQAKLCRRIERHITELFVFVGDPTVPSTNNGAERSLRHLVTARKISGGTQSPQGTSTKMTLASLFGTWRLNAINPLDACRSLLQSPDH